MNLWLPRTVHEAEFLVSMPRLRSTLGPASWRNSAEPFRIARPFIIVDHAL